MTKRKQTTPSKPQVRCAIYTRTAAQQKHDELPNSLAEQRKAGEAYIRSQQHLGWLCLPDRYDDDGVNGLTLDRPALKRLLADIQDGKIDHLTIYYLDRLTRSSSDLAKLFAFFEKHGVTFSSVTEDLGDYHAFEQFVKDLLGWG